MGKTVVEVGNTVRFNPKYPDDLIQFYSVEESLKNSQKGFYAIKLDEKTDRVCICRELKELKIFPYIEADVVEQ